MKVLFSHEILNVSRFLTFVMSCGNKFCMLCHKRIISASILNLSLGSLHQWLLFICVYRMVNPLMSWVADFRNISHFTLFPLPSLKNPAEGSLEGHFVRFPTQETVESTCLKLLWLCLNNCMEFSSFQTRDTCSRAALLPPG